MAATNTLKIAFECNDGSTLTQSLLDPKNNLTLSEVTTYANLAITKQAFMRNSSLLANLGDAYISRVERVELS